MKLIVGLGNPGKEYEKTRHNIGFMIVDNYVDNQNWKEKFNSYYQEKTINNEKVIFIKPKTYMNLSGEAVIKFINYYNINLSNVLIIRDDLDLECGELKFKINSSSGGHNGIKSIIEHTKSKDFCQMKIGISHNSKNVIDYVIGNFTKKELEIINSKKYEYKEAISTFINYGIEQTMNIYNTK